MTKRYAYMLIAALAASPASATEEAMKAAFSRWEQEMSEYQAALSSAETEETRAAIKAPDGKETGKELWKAISGKTGTRKKVIKGTKGPALETTKEKIITTPTYEFEEKWAVPAVVWFLKRPQILADIFTGRETKLAETVEALLESIREKHYDSPQMAGICHLLAAKPDVERYEMLKKIYLHNPDRNAKGCAALGMSILLGNPMVSSAEGSEAMAMNKRLYYLKQALTLTDDNTTFGDISLSEAASNQTYIIRHLTKGQTPPLVTMSDADGQKANYPVKDTPSILFFWHPSERIGTDIVSKHLSLKKQYPVLQFLPITAHPLDNEQFKEDLKTLGIPHTYVDDEEGSISLAYRVSILPLAVFTGADGEILYIGYPDIKLQTALDTYFRNHPTQPVSAPAPAATGSKTNNGSDEILIQPSSRPSAIPGTPAPSSPGTPPPQQTTGTHPAAEQQSRDSSAPPANSNTDTPPPLRPMPTF